MSPPEPPLPAQALPEQALPASGGLLRRLLAPVSIAASYLAVVLGLTRDVWEDPTARVIGARGTEIHTFVWGHAWTRYALFEEGRLPYETTFINFPDGGVLWLKDIFGTLLMLPVQFVGGAALAFDVWVVLMMLMAGLFTAALVRRLGGSHAAAAVAGLAFMTHPHNLGELYNANAEAQACYVLPLWLWALLGVIDRPGPARVVIGTGALFLLLATNQYWGLAMVPVSAVVLLLRVLERPPSARVKAGAAGIAVALLGGLAFLPVALAIDASFDFDRAVTGLSVSDRLSLEPPIVLDAWGLFASEEAALGHGTPFRDLVYPGWLALLMALPAPFVARRRAFAGGAVLLALVFLVLSVGPALYWKGRLILDSAGEPIWLPFAWLAGIHPALGAMTLPSRLIALSALGAAVAMGLLLSRLRGRWQAVALAVGPLVLAEHLLLGGAPVPMASVNLPKADWARALAELPVEGAVLDLPLNAGSNDLRLTLYLQTIHNRPVQGSLLFFIRPNSTIREELEALAVVDAGYETADEQIIAFSQALDRVPGIEQRLADVGFAFLVVHDRFINATDPTIELMSQHFGPGLRFHEIVLDSYGRPDDESVTIFPLTDAAETALRDAAPGVAGYTP